MFFIILWIYYIVTEKHLKKEAWNCNATFRMKVLRKPNEQM